MLRRKAPARVESGRKALASFVIMTHMVSAIRHFSLIGIEQKSRGIHVHVESSFGQNLKQYRESRITSRILGVSTLYFGNRRFTTSRLAKECIVSQIRDIDLVVAA